jgi:hypothetical protein
VTESDALDTFVGSFYCYDMLGYMLGNILFGLCKLQDFFIRQNAEGQFHPVTLYFCPAPNHLF